MNSPRARRIKISAPSGVFTDRERLQREVLTLSGFALTVTLRAAFGLLIKNGKGWPMSKTLGRLLAAGQRAEVFEWGARAVKLYRCAAAKQTAFREAAIHAAFTEAMHALQFRSNYSWVLFAQPGERWQFTGDIFG